MLCLPIFLLLLFYWMHVLVTLYMLISQHLVYYKDDKISFLKLPPTDSNVSESFCMFLHVHEP